MSKRIGLIYEDRHPLLDAISARLQTQGCRVEWIHYSILAIGTSNQVALESFDSLYLDRMGEETAGYSTQLELLHQLTASLKIVNSPGPYSTARNKALMAQALKQGGVPIPKSAIFYRMSQLSEFYDSSGGKTCIVKSLLGCCANEIYFYPSPQHQDGVEFLLKRDGMAVAQEFILNSHRFIWRVDIVENDVIVANQRYAFNSEEEAPICNGTHGGKIERWKPAELPERVRDLALRAVQALNLQVAGVDIIPSNDGSLYVLEVNPEPDSTLGHFEFPNAIADYLVRL